MSKYFKYDVATQFSKFPGGRKREHGDFSGEEFFQDIVKPLLEKHEHVEFDLTGSSGYTTGFLDEAFGEIGAWIGEAEAKRRIRLVASDDPSAVSMAWNRIKDAAVESGKK